MKYCMANKNQSYLKDPEFLDPDVRFLLANERTLLAWLRTALTVIAGGIALLHFSADSSPQAHMGILFVLLGAIASSVGYTRFRAADTAIRIGELPRAGNGPLIQVVCVVFFSLLFVAFELLLSK
jgi:putative membrane protein